MRFDHRTDRFVVGRACFGPASAANEVAAAFRTSLRDAPRPSWQGIEYDDGTYIISLSFRDGLLHSGSIIADVDGAGRDEVQDRRRAAHLALMHALFGCDRYESERLIVHPFRHPRDGIEQIMLEVR